MKCITLHAIIDQHTWVKLSLGIILANFSLGTMMTVNLIKVNYVNAMTLPWLHVIFVFIYLQVYMARLCAHIECMCPYATD